MSKMVIGKYIRLSQEDRDLGDDKAVSNSILHQKDLIQNYIKNNPELVGCPQYEFFDDGYTGRNFERPAFEKLLEKIRAGEINCVIVKDFSRFGRDYIELGDYLERIFPFLGVRFISVNDGYDSNDYKGTTGGLDVVMKNIVYDYYSKDLSVKVTTAKKQKMKKGEYIGGHIPYGLMKNPEEKGKLMPDPEVAPVIVEIFGYALQKMRLKDIVATLNDKDYETPAAYYRRKHPGTKKYENSSALSCWTMDNVRNILQQEMFYGAVVQHKRERIGVGSKHTRAVPKDKQIIVEGMHEPIVSKEVFLQAQEIFYHWEDRKPAKARDFPLKGKVKCAVCGRSMSYRSNTIRGRDYNYFWCPLSKYQDGSQCSKEYIREADVNEVVWQSIRQLQTLADKAAGRIDEKKAGAADIHLKKVHELAELQRELERCNTEKFANMDGFMSETIGKDAFQRKRVELAEQETRLKEQIAVLEKQAQELKMEGSGETARAVEKIQSFSGAEALSADVVKALVKEVRITDREHMEIRWNFKDEVMEFIES